MNTLTIGVGKRSLSSITIDTHEPVLRPLSTREGINYLVSMSPIPVRSDNGTEETIEVAIPQTVDLRNGSVHDVHTVIQKVYVRIILDF